MKSMRPRPSESLTRSLSPPARCTIDVEARAAVQHVVTGSRRPGTSLPLRPTSLVVARPPEQLVVAVAAEQGVVALLTKQQVVAIAAEQAVVAGAAEQHVVAVAAEQPVVAAGAEQPIVAVTAFQDVAALVADQQVVAVGADQAVLVGADHLQHDFAGREQQALDALEGLDAVVRPPLICTWSESCHASA